MPKPAMIKPAVKSHAEKVSHTSVVCQLARSVTKVPTKQAIGNGTRSDESFG